MKLQTRVWLFVIAAAFWAVAVSWLFTPASTIARSQAAVGSVANSDAAWFGQQLIEGATRVTLDWILGPMLLLAAVLFWREAKQSLWSAFKIAGRAAPLILAFAALGLGGCVKPYNQPKFEEIGNNETAYVIPLQGDTTAQAKFDSVAFLEQRKVAAKRIEVPRVWVSSGYMWNSGYYQDQVRVVKVNRTPVTVEFHEDAPKNGKDADAIWVESKDSVGFSTGFSVTALVKETDTSTFLYRYNALNLAQVLGTEVRARIQQVAAKFAASYILDELRAKKNEMRDDIQADVIPFFAERGITITTIGQFGGMTYENPEIQKSIDGTFVAQQQKVVAAALLTAQADINSRLESEKQQAKRNAILLAEGEAAAITLVADAAQKAASNPAFVRLRELEVETKRVDKWNGVTPTTLIDGHNSGVSMFLPKQ